MTDGWIMDEIDSQESPYEGYEEAMDEAAMGDIRRKAGEDELRRTLKTLSTVRWKLLDFGAEGFEEEVGALDLVIEFIDDLVDR